MRNHNTLLYGKGSYICNQAAKCIGREPLKILRHSPCNRDDVSGRCARASCISLYLAGWAATHETVPVTRVFDPPPFHADPNPDPEFQKQMHIRIQIKDLIFEDDKAKKNSCTTFQKI